MIYNIRGERVRTLVDGDYPSGNYEVTWDGRNDRNERLPTGVYFYQLKLDGRIIGKRKMVLIK